MDITTEIRINDVISHIIACETLAKYHKEKKNRQKQWMYEGKVQGLESAVGTIIQKSITQVYEMVADEKLKRDLTQRKEARK